MKKISLSLIAISSAINFSYAQNIFPASGNAGVGTLSPTVLLQVNIGNPGDSGPIAIINTIDQNQPALLLSNWTGSNTSHGPRISFSNSVHGNFTMGGSDGSNNFDIARTWGTPDFRINSNGYVGIGTSTPTATFQVNNGNPGDNNSIATINTVDQNQVALTLSNWTGSNTNYGPRILFSNSDHGGFAMGGSDGSNNFDIARTWGTPDFRINSTGNVLIGQTSQVNSAYKLDVAGYVRANEIVVNTTGADFVFEPTYKLPTISSLKNYIDKNHHLPEIPSAKQMQEEGLSVGENQVKLLQKVEELTLYLIDLKKDNDAMKKENSTMKTQIKKIQNQLRQHKNSNL